MQKKYCEDSCCSGKAEVRKTAVFAKKIAVFAVAVILWLAGLVAQRFFGEIFGPWAPLVPLGAAYLLAGLPVLRNAARNLGGGRLFDENFLMTIATIGAFVIGEWEEAVGVMIFYMIGELIQETAIARSNVSIDALLALKPDKARVLREGEWVEIPAESAVIGDIVKVRSGERIPIDGMVVEGSGSAEVDMSMLTGEAAPVHASAGVEVYSGTVSLDGVLTIRATKTAGESSAAKIVELVRNARSVKAKPERFITIFARYYTPAVICAAVLVAVLPSLFGAEWTVWFRRALVLLVISCPCALVVSVPLGYFAGIGGLSRRGIMVKGAMHLDSLSRAQFVAFDKTGTLTKGVFSLVRIEPANGLDKLSLLEIAARAESESNHAVAKAVRQAAEENGILKKEKVQIRELAGLGIETEDGVLVGNRKLLADRGISADMPPTPYTAVYVARNGLCCGRILIGDVVKEKSADAVVALRRLGVSKTLMFTGDTRDGALSIAENLGIDEVEAELLPSDKVSALEKWTARGVTVFVGDGINDAPVLARADVGVVMGSGADVAVEAADVVIMTNDPDRVPEAIKHSRKVRTLITENVVFALGAKALFITMAVFGVANMWLALFADVGVCLIAVLNSSRALVGRR
ncbi:MAG: heavy metal translocating P-type ATPase [Treponema sp.]|jgi:Cd2+/Zn2+-exporting ATPase|nr:heavy metal translocating P-type ATPase [Treponema sp.]